MNELSAGKLAQVACLLEASARKPGNVHRFADFRDLDYLDFVLAAAAVADPLDRAEADGVGVAVLGAVEATRRLVATNANLGIILLLAPMAAVPLSESLPDGLPRVLAATTIHDARLVYRAIRLANPGGLGQADEQDVADEPTIILRDAMRLAADRDLIGRQYANGFEQVLREGLPALERHLGAGRNMETAIVGAFLELLGAHPDSLIARKLGDATSREASRRAREVLDAGWPDAEGGTKALRDLDAWLRGDGHRRNPGTTADLTAAVLFAALRAGTITLPRAAGPASWSGESWF
ncbi:triphosphoribosyl-dephospho-CoA synthase [Paludisphaera mucosa]|uniref:Triphosphoribosyl-dephospho-CoA synthase n=1 Tax=Paludisphaera mucosa TaxID=3030827 RepID=A0ABT6FFP6_9BACT|nr:triphosphoribosyl-dephospho-CoA synthase [Paludisphaera mucosa]MDG3006396.1 triphosphoribosyl-dephospho-CoA synthase [Paludisphaera mucosa]